MKFTNWKLDKIEDIHAEDFFWLIDRNRNHINKTFPVTVSNCIDLEKATEFIANNIQIEKDKTGYYFYIRNLETNDLIGYICIKKIDFNISKCELAYFIDKNFEGKGIISKAVSDVIAICFKELSMNKIFICTSKINFGSQQIALKNGFIQEGILREEFKNGEGILEDINYYGLLKSDYK
ncbi:ribosomal-protein-serine acetyltransferase [Flavobacterium swingsii]|jgi:ribosomal-protein-serine acetyltransferase|uniref:Ribosomal-protein-serine acetyltransferase n=1 Tax=Flavobacterium swingsii TaxID=498292 RepID=A0A1I0XBF8_9FLAO|nr:GNAT family N-acetyltransferase [Flavobacterium swingsii]SFA98365.1 ribosomal-protein-serine acetyltransferase [Flavobacterium swingsii]